MILQKSLHERTLDKLVGRLLDKYPTHNLLRDMEYKKEYHTGTIGQIDLLRITPTGTYVMYEVKTGNEKLAHAKSQYQRFQQAFPDKDIKGVYVHPNHVERL